MDSKAGRAVESYDDQRLIIEFYLELLLVSTGVANGHAGNNGLNVSVASAFLKTGLFVRKKIQHIKTLSNPLKLAKQHFILH